MAQELRDFVVSVHNQQGYITGTGFAIGKRAIATCAHVVEAAGADIGGTVRIKCPSVDEMITVEVSSGGYQPQNDIAILIAPKDLPHDITPAILSRSHQVEHTDFWSIGYRPLGRLEGVPAEGKVLGQALEVTTDPAPSQPMLVLASQHINAGMSGAPVYVPSIDRVVGMITAIWNSARRDRDTAFAISSEAILEAWPSLILEPPGKAAPEKLKPEIPKIKSPTDLEMEEYLGDYDRCNTLISRVRQQIEETIDLAQLDALNTKLDRLRQERRQISLKFKELREETGEY